MGHWINNGEMWAAYASIIGTIVLIIQILLMRQQKSGEDLMLMESNYRYIVSCLQMHVNLLEKMKDPESDRSKFYKSYTQEHRIPPEFIEIIKTTVEMAYKSNQRHNASDVTVTSAFLAYAIELANIINTAYVQIGICEEDSKQRTIERLSTSLHNAFSIANEQFLAFEKQIVRIKRRSVFNHVGKIVLYTFVFFFSIALAIPVIMFLASLVGQGAV